MFLHQKKLPPIELLCHPTKLHLSYQNQSWIFECGDRESLGKTHPFPNGYKIALNETP